MKKFPEGAVEILVKDTGIGIPEDEQDKIFNRFYQSSDSTKMERGSGIGLTIVKEYTELHKGEVKVKSTHGEGTEFSIMIPAGNHHIQETALSIADPEIDYSYPLKADVRERKKQNLVDVFDPDKTNILLVEDDAGIIEFISMSLQDKYSFVTADNGEEALHKSIQYNPDLIISDVMMPVMDGFSLCEAIKQNIKTKPIPVILLTAKTLDEHRIEGLKKGADAYLYKPFNIKLLETRIENLLKRTDQLVSSIKMNSLTKPSDVEMPSADEEFMKKLVSTIEKYISDPGLQVETLCDALGMSHSSLYRRVKGLTGETISEFIKTIRVKRAAQLLKTQNFTVAEVMDEVGFSNHSYFSKCFRKIYNQSPGSYLKEAKENS
jgi:DNA-binding response OmpR family regulator